ncbi:ABC transporter ATP-binding protein [SAR11 cluster bacterium PRT-SC02]|mgnify:FL=1|jgi:branched-chain amino acid transport system ATP-binding protein|nr:ABC transporter ATP-binding protein [SAR11 cluster bacterium PRT-SC02]|tara:strand:- start:779 stop:1504 length:726 start_codon:yes stop_codon:yes gene_type:complete
MLKINGLISGYGSVQILNGANMKVDPQSIVALLGGNGTGKSTILKACSGLIRTWSGSINFNGEDIHNDPPHKIVEKGLVQVTQGKDVFPAMSVKENLKLGGFVLKSNQKLQDNLEKVFDYFPRLNERKDQLAATLSGGELQMLCIGRGLMSNPKMIMLDEPSAALAPQIVLDIFKNINKIRKDGLTVLVVEQNVRMALLLSDYGYVIKDGIINVEGESKKLMYDDTVKDSYLGGGGTTANV